MQLARYGCRPAQPLPGPADVFPLDEGGRAVQRWFRFEAADKGDSYRITAMFDPMGERSQGISTSLQHLTCAIDGCPHDAHQAVPLLPEAGDFTTSLGIAHLPTEKIVWLR
ncbi:hypothetical protein XF35_33925 [Streptomyces platensis subsp. clarensis]|nr:hypothetical protein [Streptomyces platensis subsp. clarensis]